MLLAIDAGNTQTVVGLFRDHDLVDHWRIASAIDAGTGSGVSRSPIKGVITQK